MALGTTKVRTVAMGAVLMLPLIYGLRYPKMNNEENIRAIKDACGKALGYEDPVFRQDINYTLSHVLLAIEKKNGDDVGIDAEGYFVERKNTSEGIGLSSLWNGKGTHRINRWNLRLDDLTQQSPATLQFLADLLKNG
jgi:hypothetical protein